MKRSNKYISAVLTVLTAGFLLQGCGIQKGGQVKECPYDEYIVVDVFDITADIYRTGCKIFNFYINWAFEGQG